jgi:hypothetical protein
VKPTLAGQEDEEESSGGGGHGFVVFRGSAQVGVGVDVGVGIVSDAKGQQRHGCGLGFRDSRDAIGLTLSYTSAPTRLRTGWTPPPNYLIKPLKTKKLNQKNSKK